MPPSRRHALALLLVPALAPRTVQAGDAPPSRAAAAFAADPLTGLALRGFDPVTYFAGDPANPVPLPGRPDVELGHAGAVWRFAGAANRAAFRADTAIYAPRFDGYDVIGASRGRRVDADPLVAARIDGRLYLFRTIDGRERALADPALVAEAEARWATLDG